MLGVSFMPHLHSIFISASHVPHEGYMVSFMLFFLNKTDPYWLVVMIRYNANC